MSHCLDDRALVELYHSRRTSASAQRPQPAASRHLTRCMGCARRMRALSDDLAVLGAALAEPAPATSRSAARPRRAPALPVLALPSLPRLGWAAGLAVAALLVWIGVVAGPMRPETAATHKKVAGIRAGFTKVSAAIFEGHRAGDAAELSTGAELALLQAALDGSFGCRPGHPYAHGDCPSEHAGFTRVVASQWR